MNEMKQVGQTRYLSWEEVAHEIEVVKERVLCASTLIGETHLGDVNVVKIDLSAPYKISLLEYEDLRSFCFPALLGSWSVRLDIERVRYRNYRFTNNPPLLHRKELLLPVKDIVQEKARTLTEELEKKGLFRVRHKIGFKRDWARRLAQANLIIIDYEIVDLGKG